MNPLSDRTQPSLREFILTHWETLRQLDPQIQLLGGIGLQFKQEWVRDHAVTCFIPMASWSGEAIPRTTKDIDVGVSAQLLADVRLQGAIQRLLDEWGFAPGMNPGQRRWAWEHGSGAIVLEFHTYFPEPGMYQQLVVKDRRVKNRELHRKGYGIHGHTNEELQGFAHSFSFDMGACCLSVPNIVTAAMMKLKAFEARYAAHLGGAAQLAQAEKHARDVMRIVALETERDQSLLPAVYHDVEESALFRDCREIIRHFFSSRGQAGYEAASPFWSAENHAYLIAELATLFRL